MVNDFTTWTADTFSDQQAWILSFSGPLGLAADFVGWIYRDPLADGTSIPVSFPY